MDKYVAINMTRVITDKEKECAYAVDSFMIAFKALKNLFDECVFRFPNSYCDIRFIKRDSLSHYPISALVVTKKVVAFAYEPYDTDGDLYNGDNMVRLLDAQGERERIFLGHYEISDKAHAELAVAIQGDGFNTRIVTDYVNALNKTIEAYKHGLAEVQKAIDWYKEKISIMAENHKAKEDELLNLLNMTESRTPTLKRKNLIFVTYEFE